MPAVWPTKVEVKISEPLPRRSIAGSWYLAARNALVRLVSMASFHPASDTSGVGPISPRLPALLKATSRPPKRLRAVSTSACAKDPSRTSPATATAAPPAASIS